MRSIKKTFTYSTVKIVDKETKEVLLSKKVEGKIDESKVAIEYIKENGYNPNLDIKISEKEEVYRMSAENFMKYGEKVIEEKTETADAE